jgi:hypothetical protein
MATRTLKYTEWLKLVRGAFTGDASSHVYGYPPADVAKRLNVSRERVSQLVREGTLDTLSITTAAGRTALTLITEYSLERYLADRVPDRHRQGYFAFPG